MNGPLIRPAVADDLEAIFSISQQTWDDHVTRHPYAFVEGDWTGQIEPYLRFGVGNTKSPSETLFVAEVDGIVQGYVALSLSAQDQHKVYEIHVQDIGVRPETRQAGVGLALVQHVQNLCQDKGWDNLTALVWDGNEASAALFERAGFKGQARTFRWGPIRPLRRGVYTKDRKKPGLLFLAMLLGNLVLLAILFRWLFEALAP